VNIAGFDFGCGTDGSDNLADVAPPLASLGGADGAAQMTHFVKNDNLNIFRLPVGWQYLLNNNLGGTLDSTNFGDYNQLVQACLATGATCIIDIHNYARWNGGIIGQGGPTNEQFADVWSQLATYYAHNENIIFSLMNEPHDLDVDAWATSLQAAVTAVRTAGATSQISWFSVMIP
jgi:endoglucanase